MIFLRGPLYRGLLFYAVVFDRQEKFWYHENLSTTFYGMAQKPTNIPLIFAIAIPFIMVLLVAATIYIPSRFSPQPAYNFIYSVRGERAFAPGESYYVYEVSDGKLIRRQLLYQKDKEYAPPSADRGQKLYLYEVKGDKVSAINFEEAQKFILDDNAISPDSFIIDRGAGRENLFSVLFGGADYNSFYIRKDSVARKLKILQSSYSFDLNFIAWVIK